jgi:hypothetical protein
MPLTVILIDQISIGLNLTDHDKSRGRVGAIESMGQDP